MMETEPAFRPMREGLGEARWASIRALAEGALPTQARLAACAGVHPSTIATRAGAEAWKGLDFRHMRVRAAHRQMVELAARAKAGEELDPAERLDAAEADWPEEAGGGGLALPPELEPLPDETPEERLARIGDMVMRRADAMLRAAEAGRPLEARQISGLAAMVQIAERVTALTRDRMVTREAERDEETGEVIAAIEAQIALFAKDYAKRILVARGMDGDEAARAVEEIVADQVA